MTNPPKKIELKDYRAPEFQIPTTHLEFSLFEDHARVEASLLIQPLESGRTLILDGKDLELKSVVLNGRELQANEFILSSESLAILNPPNTPFVLKTVVHLKPQNNTSLEGLYRSDGLFCTQCEAESFRKITFYLDRPDVMSSFIVGIEADRKLYPILLSNGDLIHQEERGARHWKQYKDPFQKPCYLFALVAGDLQVLRDSFLTQSHQKVELEIYARDGLIPRCQFAMDSLKIAMRWDEERFGREYDLKAFRILAVDDFNAGAMENKGLNIFNSKLILANDETATDLDFYNIQSVVAHEYFHNWTGNRVTLRDWFHLSLKEGLTVFRDQEFSADQTSHAEERILSVNNLRERQFIEDAGPNAHPIRPLSCYSVDNFFTPTIYEKGAEVIRMMQTLVGRPGFRRGMDLYFQRHDGQAVIIEDFARAIADANQKDWTQFNQWYSQVGTPTVEVQEFFDPVLQRLKVTVSQSPAQPPLHIPLRIGILQFENGHYMDRPLEVVEGREQFSENSEGHTLLNLTKAVQEFVLKTNARAPVLSLNRHFSAPVNLHWNSTDSNLFTLMHYDSDPFNRYEAGQTLAVKILLDLTQKSSQAQSLSLPSGFIEAWEKILVSDLPEGLKNLILSLPEDSILLQSMGQLDAPAMLAARRFVQRQIGERLESQWRATYRRLQDSTRPGPRSLKNLALFYLQFCEAEQRAKSHQSLAYQQFLASRSMTDTQGALLALRGPMKEMALNSYFAKWKSDPLSLNKWFMIQAADPEPNSFDTVKELCRHPEFNLKNPNRVFAVLRTFGLNLTSFHHPINRSYEFYADQIFQLDRLNPSVAVRLASAFDVWKKLPESNQTRAKLAMEALISKGVSKNTFEIISKNLIGR